jgi:hypothetical protein
MSLPFFSHDNHGIELGIRKDDMNLDGLSLHESLNPVNRLNEVVKLIRWPDKDRSIAMPLKVASAAKQLRLAA